MAASDSPHFTLWNLGTQQLHCAFHGGPLVADAGLLAVRARERPLRVRADLAPWWPDPRSPKFVHHSVEALLTQEVYAGIDGVRQAFSLLFRSQGILTPALAQVEKQLGHIAEVAEMSAFIRASTRGICFGQRHIDAA